MATEKAIHRYQKISAGKTVHDHAVETFVSSKVAEGIFDSPVGSSISVTLESPFAEVLAASGAKKSKRTGNLSAASRFDICVYERGKPTAVIEVKKRFAAHKGDNDVNRLLSAIRYCGPECEGSLRLGFWLAIQRIADGARSTPGKQINTFIESFDWPVEPAIEHKVLIGDFGHFKRSGRAIKEIRIYLAVFKALD
jgi:hypothetical protein